MCDPTLAIGAGLSAAGGVSRAWSNAATAEAIKKAEKDAYTRSKAARTAEIGRQAGWEADSRAGIDNTISALGKPAYDASRDTAISSFMDTLDARPGLEGGFSLPGQDTASPEVQQEIARRAAAASGEARSRIEALAKLSSYDGAALDRTLALGKNADALSTIGGFRRGSLGVSQGEQTVPAAQVLPNENLLADILSGSGGVVSGMYQPGTSSVGSAWSGGWGSSAFN